jgi:transcriptional repressor NrdR
MRCPFCHDDNDRVLDTRSVDDGYVIRRKRVCTVCQKRFTTLEAIEHMVLRVVKRNQTREPFDREKIRRGIERACSKRAIDSGRIERIVQAVEKDIYSQHDVEVPTEEIGEFVMRRLAAEDQVAYIRFASVYREFETAKDFIQAVSRIVKESED